MNFLFNSGQRSALARKAGRSDQPPHPVGHNRRSAQHVRCDLRAVVVRFILHGAALHAAPTMAAGVLDSWLGSFSEGAGHDP